MKRRSALAKLAYHFTNKEEIAKDLYHLLFTLEDIIKIPEMSKIYPSLVSFDASFIIFIIGGNKRFLSYQFFCGTLFILT